MAHTKETSVVRSNTLEQWRQKTNKISYDLGSLYDLDSNLTDSILEFTATEGQTNFYSDSLAIAFAPQQEVDNTAGSIILVPGATVDAGFVADERVFQGPEGSETWQATIVSVSDDKIIVKQSVGNFAADEDIVLTDDTDVTLAAADISSLISESYKTIYSEVYVDGVEQEQSMVTAGFHAPAYNSRIVLAGSPTIPDSFVEGATIYQGTLGSETFVGTILYVEGTSNIHLKSVTSGTFSPSAMVKVGNGDTNNRVLAANISTMVQIDQDHACMIELHTPASAGDVVKVVFFNTVRALNELQDDIGITENLTTTAGNLVGAVNELDAEIGDTSEFSTVTATNDTVSTAIKTLHDEVGDITALDNLIAATTLVGASNELQTDIGDVSTLTTTNKTVVTAINEHETDIGNMSFTGLDATDISAAIRELRVDLGDVTAGNMGTTATNAVGAISELEVEIDTLNTLVEPTQAFNANFTASTIMDGINELMTDLGDVTAGNMGTTATTVVTAIAELEGEIDDLNTYTGEGTTLSTTATTLAGAVNEHEGDIGDMTFTGLDATNISAAIRELRTDLGDVTAGNMGTTASTVVTAMSELETEIDTLNTRVEPTQAFNSWFDVYDEQDPPQLIPNTIMDGINKLAVDKFNLTSTNDQTINSNISLTTGNTLTVPSGATLDVSGGTLLVGGGGSTLTFDTAFITLGSDAATEGLQIDRSEIDGVTLLSTTDAKLQWNEGKVGTGSSNTSHRAWQLVGFTNDSTPVVNTSDIVTFYNAKDLVSNNTETNITVGWDATNQNFDFALNNAISLTSVTASGNVGAATMTTGTLATTGNVTVGGNLTVSGTVTTINTETVNIADNIIVLNSNESGVPGEDAGIEVERGTSTNVALAWDESEDRWRFTNNGTTYYNIPVPSEYDNYTSWTIRDGDSTTFTITSGDTLQIAEGTGINSNFTADDVLTISNTKPFDYLSMIDGDGTSISLANTNSWTFTEGAGTGATIDINHTDTAGPAYATTFTVTNTDRGSSQNIFKNVAVSGQSTIVADNNNDTLNVVAGNAMTLITDAGTDTLIIAHADTSTLSGTSGGNNNGVVIEDITVDSNGHITSIGTRDLDGRFDNYLNWSLFVDGVDKDNVTSGEKVDFAATAPLSVAHTIESGNVLTWTHDNSGVTAGSYGQTGVEDGQYIKSITVNATGHVTAVSSDDFDDRYDNYSSWTARDHDGTSYTVTSGDVLQYKEGTGMDVNFTADDVLTFTNTDRGSSQNIFKNIAVSGQNTIVADSNSDTLNFSAGDAMVITTDSSTDTVFITHANTSDQGSVDNSGRTYIQDITLDQFGHITAIASATETVVDTNTTYSISAVDSGSDAIIRLTAGGSGSGTDDVKLVAGSNITLTPSGDNITITATNTQRPIHDTPVDGATTTSISSNWAFDNVKTAVPAGALFTDTWAGTNLSFSRDTNGLTVTSSTGSNVSLPAATDSLWGVMTDGMVLKLNSIATGATNTAAPAITTNGSTPSLASGITAAEVRSLIGAGTATVNDTGTPAILVTGSSGGAVPALNTGISALEMRQLLDVTELSNDTGSAPYYGARAWFDVAYTPGSEYVPAAFTLAAGGNISSITLTTTSRAVVNFTTAMASANYAVAATGNRYLKAADSTQAAVIIGNPTKATTNFTLNFYDKIDTDSTSNWQTPNSFSGMVVG